MRMDYGHGYMDHELSSASPSPSLPLPSPLIPPLVTLGLTQNLRLVEPGRNLEMGNLVSDHRTISVLSGLGRLGRIRVCQRSIIYP